MTDLASGASLSSEPSTTGSSGTAALSASTTEAPSRYTYPSDAVTPADAVTPVDAVTPSDAVTQPTGGVFGQAGDAVHDAADVVHEAAGRAYEATREAAGNLVSRIRNNATVPAERGRTTIADEVVEKIAGIAAREVPGVYDLGGDAARLVSAVRERLRLGDESAAQGVSVKLEGKQAEIIVVIVIEYGFQVFSVTEKVREKVISSVENLLGLEVTAVDVTVDDVHIEQDAPHGNDAERAAGYSPETKAIVVGAPVTG